jgi:hypothetical protein
MPSVPVCPGVVPGGGAMIPPLLVSAPQLAEASPSSPTLLPQALTGTVGDTPSTLTPASLPDPSAGVEPPSPDGWMVPPLPVCCPVPQAAEASPRAPTELPHTVTGTDGETLAMPASTWLPEARSSNRCR